MTSIQFELRPERPEDAAAIESINAQAFGPGRLAKAAYRLREGVAHEAALSFVAAAVSSPIGTVRMTPIRIGERPALLLGPLAVLPDWSGRGAGRALVRRALEAARAAGHAVVLLVGDESYYGPLGFSRLAPNAITLPGPVDPARVLVAGLAPSALDGLAGGATARR